MFIKIKNALINTDHIISADFTPADSGIDEETDQPYSVTAMLGLRFAVTESEIKADYNGDFIAVEQNPYFRKLSGEAAESVWEYLSRAAVVL